MTRASLTPSSSMRIPHNRSFGTSGGGRRVMVTVSAAVPLALVHSTGIAATGPTATSSPSGSPFVSGASGQDGLFFVALVAFILFGLLCTFLLRRRLFLQNHVLKNERAMLRTLIDHIPECMYVKDRKGRFVIANAQLAHIIGAPTSQYLVGKTDYEFFPFELAQGFDRDEQRVMELGVGLFDHEEAGIDCDGAMTAVLTTKIPLRDADGAVIGIVGVGRDISERKRNEQALREAELRYRSMFDEALVGIFTLNADGGFIHVNPAMAQIFGFINQDAMLGEIDFPLWSFVVSKERRDQLVHLVTSNGNVHAFECEVRKADGTQIWVCASLHAKRIHGVTSSFGGILEDITERRQLREQLLQSQKLESVGQLAAGIAHEINTPVQYIGDNVCFLKDAFESLLRLHAVYERLAFAAKSGESLTRQIADASATYSDVDADYLQEEVPKALEQTLEGISRVAALVGAMKEFSHPGTGEKVLLDINRALQSTITVSRNEWKYVADMSLDLEVALPLVLCLPGELNQVFLNIIVNAAHAIGERAAKNGPARGTISVRTRSSAESIEIRIEDTGGGIPEAARARIFDPFFTTKEIGKGTGQGLAIARSVIVDKHEGILDFETELGRGTAFIIRLPRECDETSDRTGQAA